MSPFLNLGLLAIEIKPYILALLLSLARSYAFLATAQILPPSAMPRMARSATVLVLVMPLVPVNIVYARTFDPTIGTFAIFFGKEYVVGFFMGYCVSWLFWAVQAAGAFIDNQRGAAIAASIDPLQGHETSPLGNLFSQAFLTYFFSVGGFLLVVELLYRSFEIWPVTRGVPIILDDFPAFALQIIDNGMRLMFVLAAPIIAIMFLAEFSLAMVSRFAPQIQVFILAMPIKSAIAILILIFYFSTLFQVASERTSLFRPLQDRLFEMLDVGANVINERPLISPGPTP